MKARLVSAGMLLCLGAGCLGPSTLPPPIPPPNSGSDIVVRVQIVVVTNGGKTLWDQPALDARIEALRVDWVRMGFEFMVNQQKIDQPGWTDVSELQIAQMQKVSQSVAEQTGELIVWMVNSLHWGGKSYGGLGFLPSNTTGPSAHGVFCARPSYSNVISHELGHAFGLDHAWVKDHCDDTPEATQDGFCALDRCNDMSYCIPGGPDCLPYKFTPCQMGVVRRWALVPPRSLVVTYSGPVKKNDTAKVISTGTDPIVCDPGMSH